MVATAALARPYARALFEYADDKSSVSSWQQLLEHLAELAQQPRLQALLASPTLAKADKANLVGELLPERSVNVDNLLNLLAQNERLLLLPEISQQFMALSLQSQSIVQVQVLSAQPMDEAKLAELKARLQKLWDAKEVQMEISLDKSLIAGVVFRSGDKIIDYSIKGWLNSLGASLSI